MMYENTIEYMKELEKTKETRMNICKECGLYLETPNGCICNPHLYMNIEDKTTITDNPKIGYKRGCGCKVEKMWSIPFRHCSFNKW